MNTWVASLDTLIRQIQPPIIRFLTILLISLLFSCAPVRNESSLGGGREVAGQASGSRRLIEIGYQLLDEIKVPTSFRKIRDYTDRNSVNRQFLGPSTTVNWSIIHVPESYSRQDNLSGYRNFERASGWNIENMWFGQAPEGNNRCVLFLKVARDVRRVNSLLSMRQREAVRKERKSLIQLSASCGLKAP